MMDQFIAAKLLSMIPDGAKVVFVGDPDQLPSVGAGNVLREMILQQGCSNNQTERHFPSGTG